MQYFDCHSILDEGSTVAHSKNNRLEIIGLGVQTSLIIFQRKILVNWVAKVYYIECA